MPALPGAQSSSAPRGAREARTIACSRPPPPTTRTFNRLERVASSSPDIAESVWLVIVPREPSSTETLAITFSSGASTTVTKSYWPSVAYWASTLAPICSTSLLTSATRPGLFFKV